MQSERSRQEIILEADPIKELQRLASIYYSLGMTQQAAEVLHAIATMRQRQSEFQRYRARGE